MPCFGRLHCWRSFLLRISEYAANDQSGEDVGKGVRGIDLQGKLRGKVGSRLAEADELVLRIRGSKTDQLNRGEWRNHFRRGEHTEDGALCVVEAMACYEKHAPERFRGSEKCSPLFVWASGRLLTKGDMKALLERAAVAAGVHPDSIGTHSLRIGGASALWAAYKDSALVQRWGRWTSNAFHAYLWDAREAAKGVSDRMVAADLTPV